MVYFSYGLPCTVCRKNRRHSAHLSSIWGEIKTILYRQELCVEPFGLLKKLIWFLKVFNNDLEVFVVGISGMCSLVIIVVKTCHTTKIGMGISLVTADPDFFESQEKDSVNTCKVLLFIGRRNGIYLTRQRYSRKGFSAKWRYCVLAIFSQLRQDFQRNSGCSLGQNVSQTSVANCRQSKFRKQGMISEGYSN